MTPAIPGSQWDSPRPPSPADIRNNLHPVHVDALANEVHDLLCRPLWTGHDPNAADPRHREVDLGKARFLLIGLSDNHGLTLAPEQP